MPMPEPGTDADAHTPRRHQSGCKDLEKATGAVHIEQRIVTVRATPKDALKPPFARKIFRTNAQHESSFIRESLSRRFRYNPQPPTPEPSLYTAGGTCTLPSSTQTSSGLPATPLALPEPMKAKDFDADIAPVFVQDRGLTESDAETGGPGANDLLGMPHDVAAATAATAQPTSLTFGDNTAANAEPPGTNSANRAAAEHPTGADGCVHSDVSVCPFTGKSAGTAAGACPFGGSRASRGAALNHEPHARSEPPYDDDSAYLGKSASEQLEMLWLRLLEARRPSGEEENVKFPSLSSLHKELLGNRSYERLLKSREDVKASSKALCAVGAVARAQIVWDQGDADARARYTGLFGADEVVEGLLRLSTAAEPPSSSSSVPLPLRGSLRLFGGGLGSARLFPCAAFKAPRDGSPSGNLLFAGRKVGQASTSFFDSHIATCVTERASTVLKPFMEAFRKYSAYPTHLGLSDFASAATDGKKVVDPVFPWALVLRPTEAATRFENGTHEAVDENTAFLSDIARINAGTTLYDIYAVPTPSAALEGVSKDGSERLHKIGRITTTSEFVFSDADGTICFWHQRKEEDYAHRPDWERALTPAHAQSCGAEHFARIIEKGISA